MKLRVRAASGGPTVRVVVPPPCSLQAVKEALAPLISLPPAAFSLSLNKKDVISGPGTTLLSSFGVTSGDLLFYLLGSQEADLPAGSTFLHPDVGASSIGRASWDVCSRLDRGMVGSQNYPQREGTVERTGVIGLDQRREICAAAAIRRAQSNEAHQEDSAPITVTSSSCASVGVTENPDLNSASASQSEMEVQTHVFPESYPLQASSSKYHTLIPDLLQRVLSTEIGNELEGQAFLTLAVHAVMLETGFVRIDVGENGVSYEGNGLPSGWSTMGLVNLVYSLPELRSADSVSHNSMGEVLLRCQVLGNSVVVYGAVLGRKVYRLILPAPMYLSEGFNSRSSVGREAIQQDTRIEAMDTDVPARTSAWGESVAKRSLAGIVFRDIFGLWKEVKDSLSLPLLTDICEKAGLPPPPSLLLLPTELKLRVLESLTATTLAMMECVCSELRFLSANEDIWKRKFSEEFGYSGESAPAGRGWRYAFAWEWENRRRRDKAWRVAERRFRDIFPNGPSLRSINMPPHFGPVDFFRGLGGSRNFLGRFAPDMAGACRSFGCRGGLIGNLFGIFSNSCVGRLELRGWSLTDRSVGDMFADPDAFPSWPSGSLRSLHAGRFGSSVRILETPSLSFLLPIGSLEKIRWPLEFTGSIEGQKGSVLLPGINKCRILVSEAFMWLHPRKE